MVMPCSRSARRPSVSRARSVYSSPRWRLHPLDRLELVLEDRLGVVEEPADQGALAVVDRSGGGESQQLHQKYPSRLRSSMAASLTRSSARVAPRSVSREAATSRMMSSTDAGRRLDGPGAGHVAHRAVAHGGLEDLLVVPGR